MEIDDRKFAAFIRHFGRKLEGEDAYVLEIPLSEWRAVPKNSRVIPADNPHWPKVSETGFTTFPGEEATVAF